MKEITERLHNKVMEEFGNIAEDMANNGCTKDQIVAAYQAQMRVKTNQYYDNLKRMKSMGDVLKNIEYKQTADSKAELIFCEMLTKQKIKFEFQFAIGPYRVDYLINKYLVVEIDGPQHDKVRDEKRDKYLKKMGFRVFRIPLWLLVASPEAAIEEIKSALYVRSLFKLVVGGKEWKCSQLNQVT